MALDPKAYKELANVIKMLSSTGEDVAKRTRDLITIMVSIQRGWIETGDRIDKVLSDVVSGKVDKSKFSETLKEFAKTEDALDRIKALSDEIHEIDEDRLKTVESEADIIKLSLELFREKRSVVNEITTLYDTITTQLQQETDYLKSSGIHVKNHSEYLQQQIKARGTLMVMMRHTLLSEKHIEKSIGNIKTAIDNIGDAEIKITGVGVFDRSSIYDEMEKLSTDSIRLIDTEISLLDSKLRALAARDMDMEINFRTGEVVRLDTNEVLQGDALKNASKQIDKAAGSYQHLVGLIASGGELSSKQSKRLSEASKLILEAAAAKRQELDVWKETFKVQMNSLSVELARDRGGLMMEISQLYTKVDKQIAAEEKRLSDNNVLVKDQVGYLREKLRLSGALSEITKYQVLDSKKLTQQFANIQSVIEHIGATEFTIEGIGTFDRAGIIKELSKASDESVNLISSELDILDRQLRAIAARSLDMEINFSTGEVIDINSQEVLSGKDLKIAQQLISSATGEYGKLVQQISDGKELTDQQRSQLDSTTQMILEAVGAKQEELVLWKKSLSTSTANLNLLAKYAPHIRAANAASESMAQSFEKLFSYIPKGIREFLGLSDIGNQIRSVNESALKEFKDQLLSTGSPTKALSSAFGKWGGLIGKIVNPLTIAVGLTTIMWKLTDSIQKSYVELSHRMGISTDAAKKLYHANLDVVSSQKNQYLTLREIEDVQQAYLASTGKTLELTKASGQQLALSLGEMTKEFGYSAETAVGIYETFKELGADTTLANKLQIELGLMSQIAGVSAHMVGKDLLDAAEGVSTYFAGMPEMAARTALQVRRMGMNLKQATDIAERMLNLEGFMTDMFELAAMDGPDLSSAFEFGIRGDIEGMTESMLDSIGTLKAFGEMDFLQRKKLAQTIGMSVDDLSHTLMLREKLMNLSDEESKYVNANLDAFGKIEGMNQDAIRAKIDDMQTTEKLSVAWDKIKAVLIKAILPAVESFSDILQSTSPLIDTVIDLARLLGGVLKGVGWVVSGMLLPLKWISDLIGYIRGLFASTGDEVEVLQANVGGVSIAFQWVIDKAQTLIGIVTAGAMTKHILGMFIPALGKSTGMLGMLGKVAKGSFGMITSSIGGIVGKFKPLEKLATKFGAGGLFKKMFGEAPTKKFDEVTKRWRDAKGKFVKAPGGSIAESLTDTAKGSKMESPKQSMGDKLHQRVKSMKGGIKSGMDEVTKIVKSVWGTIKAVFNEIIDFATGVLQKIVSSIGKAIKTLLSSIGEGLSSFGPKAIQGAATMLVLSGALWVTSKALQNFSGLDWNTIAMAGTTLIGLAGVALVLGSASAQMIIGAAAIAILGAALIPAAYALGMFSDISWDSLAKAGTALVGLGIAAGVLGTVAPLMIIGAVAIGALGLALIPMAYSMSLLESVSWDSIQQLGVVLAMLGSYGAIFGSVAPLLVVGAVAIGALGLALIPLAIGMSKLEAVDWSALSQATVVLAGLGGIAAVMGLAAPLLMMGAVAIGALGLALLPFSAALATIAQSNLHDMSSGLMALSTGILALSAAGATGGIMNLFAGDPLEKLKELATIASPLDIAANAVHMLGESLTQLSIALQNIDLSKLDGLDKMKGIATSIGIGYKLTSGGESSSSPSTPSAMSTAQNVQIQPPSMESTGQHVTMPFTPNTGGDEFDSDRYVQREVEQRRQSQGSSSKIESLLTQLIMEVQGMNTRPIVLDFGDGVVKELNRRTRGLNNNR